MLEKVSRQIAICEFNEKFDICFNEDTVAQTFNSFILVDSQGYALSVTFYRIDIELLIFKLCPVLFG